MADQKAENKQEEESNPSVVLGAMEMGRRLNEEQANLVAEAFLSKTKFKEIDAAYMYQGGKTELFLGRMNKKLLAPQKGLVATKAFPGYKLGLTDKGIREQLQTSLSRLQSKQCDIFYLHWPDHKTPIEESLKTVNDLFKQGKFKRFGLSNYASWQVTEIFYLCEKNGYVKPTVYQGMYNAITRAVESELFPCLRRFGLSFKAYNPMAGGLLSGKHKFEQLEQNSIEKGGRFHGSAKWSVAYRNRFWSKSKFDGIELIKESLKSVYGTNNDGTLKVTPAQASLRWLAKHSVLNKDDSVIMGPSSMNYFNENLEALQCKEPLDKKVVEAFDEAWNLCKGDCPVYFR